MGEEWLNNNIIQNVAYSAHKNPLKQILSDLNPDLLGDMLVAAYMAGHKRCEDEALEAIGEFGQRRSIIYSCIFVCDFDDKLLQEVSEPL